MVTIWSHSLLRFPRRCTSLAGCSTPVVAKHLTIGELAEAAGVPTSTIRYYERARLLKPSARSPSNYRLYSSSDLERLRFIRAAQATGFTLDDVTKLRRSGMS